MEVIDVTVEKAALIETKEDKIEQENQEVIKSLQPGDVLKFKRKGYSHFGIYIGEDKVIHRDGTPHMKFSGYGAVVREDELKDVIKESTLTRIDVTTSQFSRDEILARARSKLGEEGYDLFTNNCEHFVYWAAFGEDRSYQVERLDKVATAVAMPFYLAGTTTLQLGGAVKHSLENIRGHADTGTPMSTAVSLEVAKGILVTGNTLEKVQTKVIGAMVDINEEIEAGDSVSSAIFHRIGRSFRRHYKRTSDKMHSRLSL